jgi:hypothetical protein
VISLIALYHFALKHPFSANASHWFFVFYFFFYAGLMQYLANKFPGQIDVGQGPEYCLKTNILIIFWCIIYSLVYHFALKHIRRMKSRTQIDIPALDLDKKTFIKLLFLTITATIIAYLALGASAMFARNANADIGNDNSALRLIISILGRTTPVIILIISLYAKDKTFFTRSFQFIFFCFFLLADFPTSTSRFFFGAYIIAIISVIIRNKKISMLWLFTSLVISFMFVLPIMNAFRVKTFSAIKIQSPQSKRNTDDYYVPGADFDAYGTLVDTVSYVDQYEMQYGHQVLGVILFFVPRDIWPDKPAGSSLIFMKHTTAKFFNLSTALPAEGYIDFSIFGVALYAAVFAYLIAKLDGSYWYSSFDHKFSSLTMVFYPFFVPYVIIIMRGSLLSMYAYTMGVFVAVLISLRLSGIKKLVHS